MFFDRPDSGELAVLVHLEIPQSAESDDPREFEELVLSAGGDPVELLSGQRSAPHPKYFIGTGKLEELQALVQQHQAELVIFNHELSPSQERNLEKALECRVLDRTGLILDIFAQRARTHEGKLQVELAQLEHMSTRLIRGWTHLERQKGGIGLRGPGETQLETDRRLLRARIKTIGKRLEKVRKQREQGRRARNRADIPTVSLVGYTNAGKSTLFNAITDAGVFAQDQLFATLDPTMRRIGLPDVGPAVLADTVGFISNLPHRLVESFRATLEEASSSDLLLHVIDAADDERQRNIEQVNLVLEEIDAHELPCLMVYNKIDLLSDMAPRIDRDDQGRPVAVWLSAKNAADNPVNISLLFQALAELLAEDIFQQSVYLGAAMGSLRARLYRHNAVLNESYTPDGICELEIRIPEADLKRMLSAENIALDDLLKQPEQTDYQQLAV
ncbi:GTP-binding proten HflX [Teredinibacter turnerae T7901]|uniref:GTPase HflX n=1 Tax=Teredinibacter turnerae (strain ATCC 39867 / T7901) TaxID=377629 RepID=C5BRH6_TERTT|nr:ribosome rescue GTPase HflX [Teredinibacter turnerae]ACR14113.1 GTP-binding proten HflX [Teredinibacter turnerae T7901]